ncbi:putative DNA topoisomerase IA [Trypanosoma cruzi]|uniref:Putative DNA topoisomerase IA n=1 Tax=Trypanosoma cruzi TaxID=5693 RepID=A0A2V2V387_TRYCR|nr:putative DNA topoisomerase IA [Trypanosoma cruzi]
MMRRTLAALEKLVIVESPQQGDQSRGASERPECHPGLVLQTGAPQAPGRGSRKAVAMATTGHFMAMKEIQWTPRAISFPEVRGAGEEPFPPNGTVAEYTLEWQLLPGRRIQETLERYIEEKLNNVTEIILATDPDREGELIAVHALQTIKRLYPKLKVPYSRAYMHSITEDGIRKAMRERLVDKV